MFNSVLYTNILIFYLLLLGNVERIRLSSGMQEKTCIDLLHLNKEKSPTEPPRSQEGAGKVSRL